MIKEYKNYRIVYTSFSLLRIMNMGKGAIPKALNGTYTSISQATAAIDGYLDSKGNSDGKAISSTGD